MTEERVAIGVDVGGTTFSVALVDRQGKILFLDEAETLAEQGAEAVVERIIASIRRLLDKAEVGPEGLAGIGMGIPGLHDRERGVVITSPNLKWENVPIRDRVRSVIDTNFYMDGDVRVAAIGERYFGAAADCEVIDMEAGNLVSVAGSGDDRQGLSGKRSNYVGSPTQNLSGMNGQRQHGCSHLDSIGKGKTFFSLQRKRLDTCHRQSLVARYYLPSETRHPPAQEHKRHMSQGSQVSAGAHRSLLGHHRSHTAVQEVHEGLYSPEPHS